MKSGGADLEIVAVFTKNTIVNMKSGGVEVKSGGAEVESAIANMKSGGAEVTIAQMILQPKQIL